MEYYIYFLVAIFLLQLYEKKIFQHKELTLMLYGGKEIFPFVGVLRRILPFLILISTILEALITDRENILDVNNILFFSSLFLLGLMLRMILLFRMKEFNSDSILLLRHPKRPSFLIYFLWEMTTIIYLSMMVAISNAQLTLIVFVPPLMVLSLLQCLVQWKTRNKISESFF